MNALISIFCIFGVLTISQGLDMVHVKDMLSCMSIQESAYRDQDRKERDMVVTMLIQSPKTSCSCITESLPNLESYGKLMSDYSRYCLDDKSRYMLSRGLHGDGKSNDDAHERNDDTNESNDDEDAPEKKSSKHESDEENDANTKNKTRYAMLGGQLAKFLISR